MRPWGTGNFENNDALDWAAELEDSPGLTMLKEAFGRVEKNKYPDSSNCCMALAAAEIVAAAKGKPATDLPETIQTWLDSREDSNGIQSLDKTAIKIVNKISNKSELKELWEESEDWQKWQRSLDGLQQRLKP